MPDEVATNPAGAERASAKSEASTPAGIGAELTEDLPAKAADLVDSAVSLVRDKAIRPLILVARGIVYGTVAAVLAIFVIVMVAIGLIRLLDVYAFPGDIWASYLLVGFVFSASGITLWALRTSRNDGA